MTRTDIHTYVFEGCMRYFTNCCALGLGVSNFLYVFVDGQTILKFQNGHRDTKPPSCMVEPSQRILKKGNFHPLGLPSIDNESQSLTQVN